jgi:hypothetical protein
VVADRPLVGVSGRPIRYYTTATGAGWQSGSVRQVVKGGSVAYGIVLVFEGVTEADQDAFMATRLGAALGAVGVPAPVQVIESGLVNYPTP